MFPKFEEINWTHWYKMKNFIVFDVPHQWIPFNIFTSIERYLLNDNIIPNFDNNRKIIDSIYSDYILIEYNNRSMRDKDKKLMQEKINIINPIKTEIIDWNKQIAEPVWYFDLDWKYYLVISPYNPFTDEINPELWIYKWVIVNPELYFWKIWGEIREIENKVDDILK